MDALQESTVRLKMVKMAARFASLAGITQVEMNQLASNALQDFTLVVHFALSAFKVDTLQKCLLIQKVLAKRARQASMALLQV